ncbi:hypothetical protein K466DRAFT_591340 [Polyporus arcularius HHB13444]|uniref:Transmembrane protein n=1 Tax=Polyporus arcularius HHB13444 TaxID=1314778 RepID=A0A5C3NVB5_9APHY|nr:hypothetical protein K466DRAFT_591340 [Polyporus arcularius HHB13444]
MLFSLAQTQRAALLIAVASAATHALPISADLSALGVDSKNELEESSFRALPFQEMRRDLAADVIDAELSLIIPSATVDQGGSMLATRAVLLDAATTSTSVPTSQAGESCPVAVAVLTSKWQLDVFPIATLVILSCVLILLTALLTSHIIRIRRFTRSSPVLVSPPSPRSVRVLSVLLRPTTPSHDLPQRNLSITVPSREASIKGDGGKSLHPITEDPFPCTPTQQRISTFARPLSPSPPYNPARMTSPDSPARSTFTSKSLPRDLEKKPSFLSLKD